jgi:hypothetical protein
VLLLPEENSESQLDDHEEELLRHPVAVDVSVERVRAVQIVVEFVRMLVNLNLKGSFNGILKNGINVYIDVLSFN